jgi:hypothetical protein
MKKRNRFIGLFIGVYKFSKIRRRRYRIAFSILQSSVECLIDIHDIVLVWLPPTRISAEKTTLQFSR